MNLIKYNILPRNKKTEDDIKEKVGRDEVKPVQGIYNSGGITLGLMAVASEMVNKILYSQWKTSI